MPREVEPSLNEKLFFAKALQENIRLDGRAFDQLRALELDFGDEYGVADVGLGKTRYLVFFPADSTLFCSILCSLLKKKGINVDQTHLRNLTDSPAESTHTSQQKSQHPSPTGPSMASSP
jgi:hypothetical protein